MVLMLFSVWTDFQGILLDLTLLLQVKSLKVWISFRRSSLWDRNLVLLRRKSLSQNLVPFKADEQRESYCYNYLVRVFFFV